MRSLFFSIVTLILIRQNADAQYLNLIPNPGFEEMDFTKPHNRESFDNDFNPCKFWYNPNKASPDYLNELALWYFKLTEVNDLVLLASLKDPFCARTGQGFCGLGVHRPYLGWAGNSNRNYSEYVSIKLNQTLRKDKYYYAGFYVRAGNNINGGLYCNAIGMHFSADSLWSEKRIVFNLEAQVQNPVENIIRDSLQFRRIDGIFKANGNERFLTMGNFLKGEDIRIEFDPWLYIDLRNGKDSVFATKDGGYANGADSYLYIDDVFLFELGGGVDLKAFKDSIEWVRRLENRMADSLNQAYYSRYHDFDFAKVVDYQPFKLNKLVFEQDKFYLVKWENSELKKMAKYLRKHSRLQVTIEAEVPEGLISAKEELLVQNRGKYLKERLRQLGVSPEKVVLIPYKANKKNKTPPAVDVESHIEFVFTFKKKK